MNTEGPPVAWPAAEVGFGCVERGAGASATNVAQDAHAAAASEYPGEAVQVFEHYPAAAGADYPEHFDEITVVRGRPRLRRCTVEETVGFLGEQVLDDMPELPADPVPKFRR